MIKFKYNYMGGDYYADFDEKFEGWSDPSVPAFALLNIASKRSLALLHHELYVMSPKHYFVDEVINTLSFVGITAQCLNLPIIDTYPDLIY